MLRRMLPIVLVGIVVLTLFVDWSARREPHPELLETVGLSLVLAVCGFAVRPARMSSYAPYALVGLLSGLLVIRFVAYAPPTIEPPPRPPQLIVGDGPPPAPSAPSAPDWFVPMLWLLLTVAVAATVAVVLAYAVSARTPTDESAPPSPPSRVAAVASLVAGVLALLCAVGTYLGQDDVWDQSVALLAEDTVSEFSRLWWPILALGCLAFFTALIAWAAARSARPQPPALAGGLALATWASLWRHGAFDWIYPHSGDYIDLPPIYGTYVNWLPRLLVLGVLAQLVAAVALSLRRPAW